MPDLSHVLRLDDFEPLARANLDAPAYAYYRSAAYDEVTFEDNVAAFRRRKLRPRVLVDVAQVDTSAEILGTRVALPVGWAATAQHGLAHPDGEIASARAAARAGAVFCLSTMSSRSLEDVALAADGPMWFQLYAHKDRAITEELVGRAREAGYSAVVVTADLPKLGYREAELRNPLDPGRYSLGNFARAETGDFLDVVGGLVNDALTWDDLAWIGEAAQLPIVVKGVLTAEDARRAVEAGVAGLVVSNHGGRQLDRAPASIEVLEEVVDAVAGGCEVFLDGGVRRGTDVAVALALGAAAVFVGRPLLYALAAAGEPGVRHAFELLRAEFENVLALLGVTSAAQLTRRHVV